MESGSLRKKIIIFFFLVSVIFFVYQFQTKIKNIFYFLSSPLQKAFFKASVETSSFFETFFEIRNLKKENENLREEIKKLSVENENLKELKKENEQLRKALGVGIEKDFKLKMAKFIGKDISGDVLLIDKGKEDGLEEGKVVISPEKFLIGKIMKVYQNFSKVKVFTFENFAFDAKIPEREIMVLVKGEGNFKAKIQLIPKEKGVLIGDKIFTSSLGGNFPEGIFVGEIEKIKNSDILTFEEAEIKPAFEIKNLDYLFVILNF